MQQNNKVYPFSAQNLLINFWGVFWLHLYFAGGISWFAANPFNPFHLISDQNWLPILCKFEN